MKAKILVMTEKREYVRQVVAYANYFKDFKKTLSRDSLRKIYPDFYLYNDVRTGSGEIS